MLRFDWRRVAGIASLGAVVVAASGCGSDAPATRASGASQLALNVAVSPATIDPAVACGPSDLLMVGNLYTRLTQYGSKPGPEGTTQVDPSKIEPYAAKSWTLSDDGKTYTFKLHPDMKFPSGRPVDSEAVKYSFERVLKMASCGIYFVTDGILEPPLIKAIETPDPLTVVIRLRQPDPGALQAWAQPAGSIVDPAVVEEHGGVQKAKINKWMQTRAAGAGPYLLESYEPNSSAVMTANPDYFGAPPKTKTIAIRFVNSDPTLLLEAKSGKADVTLGLSKQGIKSLEGDGNVRIVATESALSEQIGLPNDQPPFDSRQFREALTIALPYDEIVEKVAFGYGTTFYGPISPVFPEFNEGLSEARPYDIERAKQLIDQSGVKTPVTIEMVVQEGNTVDEQIATIAQGEWRELGVNLKIRRLSSSEYLSGLQAHKFQSYVRLDGPGVIDAGFFLAYDMVCDLPINLSEICIPKADELLGQARTESDPEKRQALWDEITAAWIAESPKIHVYAEKRVAVLSKRMKSYFASHEADFRTWSK